MRWRAYDRSLSVALAVLDLIVVLANEADATSVSVERATLDPNTFALGMGYLDPLGIASNTAEGVLATGLQFRHTAEAHSRTKGRAVTPLRRSHGVDWVREYRSRLAADGDTQVDRLRET
ncbi:hypothetical protein O1611_g9330 [Lasiodiplodia mahajangana]|uniref:Uncharacterized protein n=1 Tax=Lasiodiplodia mahajangana TaxID=1108764 RepID=A0ACC2J9Y4_9PEZI|nr:hypothetical protein O1611_g9330 [Lasiodiplodia mahajangana]